MARTEKILLGLTTGPGCWNVESAVVAVRGRGGRMKARVLASQAEPLADNLRGDLREVIWGGGCDGSKQGLGNDLGEAFISSAKAVIATANIHRDDIHAIACCSEHDLMPAANLAKKLRLPVICGFGAGDKAAGGTGQFLSAWADWVMFRDKRLSRVIVHLGSIAEITFIGSAADPRDVLAESVGPGTFLIDSICTGQLNCDFDTDGAIASRGSVDLELMNDMHSDIKRLVDSASGDRDNLTQKG